MLLDLTGKIALVAGSTQGIGLATAKQFAQSGATLILLARSEEKLKNIVSELPTPQNQNHSYLVADFSSPNTLQDALSEAQKNKGFEGAHILINNTGGPPPNKAHEASLQSFRDAFEQHLICNQILVQALLPFMKKEKFGRIINVISTSVKQPIENLGVSNTIRAAVANWAKTLSFELAQHGITVNNVLPGMTSTARLDAIIKNKAKNANISEDEAIHQLKSTIPAYRFAEPEETANAILFLASEKASYINGINLPVDGGRTKNL
ncbi:SDR family oxidoreductase [Bernardetia sp.]|uniref:SDR family oxidoreductase n=1 Tax=Bernardetia sp. TaxID=1937974 RepID=UPI0025C1118C|nr:SDR family oxidoreductase [Bernardetia sp.]